MSSGIHTCHANPIHLICIGAYGYKYIGHETANWLGCDGRRVGELSEVWVGGRRDAGDRGERLRTTGPGPRTTLDLTHVIQTTYVQNCGDSIL
jgi:hypothetical protein